MNHDISAGYHSDRWDITPIGPVSPLSPGHLARRLMRRGCSTGENAPLRRSGAVSPAPVVGKRVRIARQVDADATYADSRMTTSTGIVTLDGP
jgi:hypothetical protein